MLGAQSEWRWIVTTTAQTRHITRQLRRLGDVKYHVHSGLKGVLYELETTIEEVGNDDVFQAGRRKVNGPGGKWIITWLVSGGRPWITLKWPRSASSVMVDFMCTQALRFGLAVHQPEDSPHDRLWIPLSTQ